MSASDNISLLSDGAGRGLEEEGMSLYLRAEEGGPMASELRTDSNSVDISAVYGDVTTRNWKEEVSVKERDVFEMPAVIPLRKLAAVDLASERVRRVAR